MRCALVNDGVVLPLCVDDLAVVVTVNVVAMLLVVVSVVVAYALECIAGHFRQEFSSSLSSNLKRFFFTKFFTELQVWDQKYS